MFVLDKLDCDKTFNQIKHWPQRSRTFSNIFLKFQITILLYKTLSK